MDTLSDVRFAVSSTDPKTGLIVADQGVIGGNGTPSRLNILVGRAAGGTEINVKFVPPPGTSGGRGIADEYVRALKKRLPDLEVTQAADEGKRARDSGGY